MDADKTIQVKTSTGITLIDVTSGDDWLEVKTRVGPERFVYAKNVPSQMVEVMMMSAIQLVLMDAHTEPGINPTPFSVGA